jgi:hypothetical protein
MVADQCGGGGATIRLAREGVSKVDIIGEWQSVFASKPAPTGDLWWLEEL